MNKFVACLIAALMAALLITSCTLSVSVPPLGTPVVILPPPSPTPSDGPTPTGPLSPLPTPTSVAMSPLPLSTSMPTVTPDYTPLAPDRHEPNDVPGQAVAVADGYNERLTLHTPDDDDWFAVTLVTTSTLEARAISPDSYSSRIVALIIGDDLRTITADGPRPTGSAWAVADCLPPGRYYVMYAVAPAANVPTATYGARINVLDCDAPTAVPAFDTSPNDDQPERVFVNEFYAGVQGYCGSRAPANCQYIEDLLNETNAHNATGAIYESPEAAALAGYVAACVVDGAGDAERCAALAAGDDE